MRGSATIWLASTSSTVTTWSGWRSLRGLRAPWFQFLAAMAAKCSGRVPWSCIRRWAQRAKYAAGRMVVSNCSRPGPRLAAPRAMSVILSKARAMATSARPEATAQAASRNATSPVAEAFSTWVTGRPVRPSSFTALMPIIAAGWR